MTDGEGVVPEGSLAGPGKDGEIVGAGPSEKPKEEEVTKPEVAAEVESAPAAAPAKA